MAKRRSKRKKKQKVGGGFYTLLIMFLAFAALITINGFYPISSSLPTWQSIRAEVEGYLEDPVVKPEQVGSVDGVVEVHFIDVGQGNCTLIKSNGSYALIDGGENDQGEKVTQYLQSQGVDHLDYVVASHPHSDHIGGLDVVINQIPTTNIIMPHLEDSVVPTTKTYEDLLNAISNNGVNVIAAQMGESYDLGGGILRVVGPAAAFDDLNNSSVGIKFTYGNRRFLFTGDMESSAEQAVLRSGENLQADVFLLGHHGSATSNDDDFLDAVGAEYYVAQVGYNNQYGHPHRETLKKAQDRGVTLYRSDQNGTVIFKTDGTNLEVSTEK
ncbi:MAG: ComEC/Rec2 family competence protein [Massiliimalia sp.]|jgi:competence protein ComEC